MPDYYLIAGVGCAAFSGLFYAFYKGKNDMVKSIQSAIKVEFGEELCNTLKTSVDNSLPYVAIVGEALPQKTSDVLTSENVPDLQSLVQKMMVYELKSEWRESTREWHDVKHLLNSVIRSVPFKISSTEGSALVSEPLSANKLNLQNVYDKFEPILHNTTQAILHWAAGEKTKGFQTIEEVLPVGTRLLGIGKLSLTKDGLVLSPPSNGKPYFLTALSLESLIRNCESGKGFFKLFSIFLACTGGILFFIALYKYFKRRWSQADVELNGDFDSRAYAENSIEEPCVICLDRQRNVVILECGHICICNSCAQQISECPVCRRIISRLVPTYRS